MIWEGNGQIRTVDYFMVGLSGRKTKVCFQFRHIVIVVYLNLL